MLTKATNALRSADRYQRVRDYAVSRAWYSVPTTARRHLSRGEQHFCPICETPIRGFMTLHRPNQQWCPVCRSMQRHRLVVLYLQTRTNLFDGAAKTLLHVAPEPSLGPKLREIPGVEYLSADLMDPLAMVKMDITNIQYPEGHFDTIYCSHVLEHVPDDRQAMREFYRVLKPGGWALLLVPVRGETTFEDPTITEPAAREEAFGQFDHVRFYGMDFADRLREAGFEVEVHHPQEIAGNEVDRMGLWSGQIFFHCHKPAAAVESPIVGG